MDEKEKQYLQLFGRRVKQLRTERSLTLRQLSNRSGLDRSQISMIENGKLNVTMSTLIAIAKGLEVSLKEVSDFQAGLIGTEGDIGPFEADSG